MTGLLSPVIYLLRKNMSIITKPSSISKNVAASFSLSKSELAAVASVVADSNFSDSANWKKVFLNYKSSPGNQHRFVRFDATMENPTGDFLCSLKSKDVFELESIVIKDFDNGSLVIPASQLTASEFKIDMGSVAPSPEILTGAYTVGSNPMQNLTSRSPAEGQSFVLSSPTSVTSVKVMISKYSNPSNLPLTGTLNMTLKASDYSGSGAEVVSSNTLDLSTLATAQPTVDGGVICEFLFDTPVSLPSGTNSIKYNYAGLNVDGSTFIQVWGYSPSIGDGLAYSYGGQIAHVDFWFQILGN